MSVFKAKGEGFNVGFNVNGLGFTVVNYGLRYHDFKSVRSHISIRCLVLRVEGRHLGHRSGEELHWFGQTLKLKRTEGLEENAALKNSFRV